MENRRERLGEEREQKKQKERVGGTVQAKNKPTPRRPRTRALLLCCYASRVIRLTAVCATASTSTAIEHVNARMEYAPMAEHGRELSPGSEDVAAPPQLPPLATTDANRLKLEAIMSDTLIVSETTLPMLKNMQDEARIKCTDAQRRLANKKEQLEALVCAWRKERERGCVSACLWSSHLLQAYSLDIILKKA